VDSVSHNLIIIIIIIMIIGFLVILD